MMVKTFARGLRKVSSESDAAVSTTVTAKAVPKGVDEVTIKLTAAGKFNLCPRIKAALFYDSAAGTYTRFEDRINDNGSTKTTTLLDSMLAADKIYICTDVKSGRFRGMEVLMNDSSPNGNASVMTVKYGDDDDSWVDISDTDGTDSGGATLAQDGQITWTLPGSAWIETTVNGITGYWVQINISAALDADTEIEEIILLNEESTGFAASADVEYSVPITREDVAGVEVLADSGTVTATLSYTYF